MEEVRKSRPSTLTELKAVVEAFAESVDPKEVKRSAPRAPGIVPGPAGQLRAQTSRAAKRKS